MNRIESIRSTNNVIDYAHFSNKIREAPWAGYLLRLMIFNLWASHFFLRKKKKGERQITIIKNVNLFRQINGSYIFIV